MIVSKKSLRRHYLKQLNEIEDDHKQLFRIADRLDSAIHNTKKSLDISVILTEMVDYAGGHFLNEERLMDSISYIHADAHIAEHWKFLGTISVFIAEFEKGTLNLSAVNRFVQTWISTHINHYDRDFELFLEAPSPVMVNDNLYDSSVAA